MAVTKRLRYEILRRDGHTCGYCGAKAPDVNLTVDHVVPRALGGTDDPANLVAACADCNSGKAASNPDAPLVAEADHKAAQWAQAMEIAVSRRQAELSDERGVHARFESAWAAWGDRDGNPAPWDGNWRNTISRFLAQGLDEEFITAAVDRAHGNQKVPTRDVWRYFCGICWRERDKIVEIAAEIVEQTAGPDRAAASKAVLDPRFDVLNRADGFLNDVLNALDANGESRRCVHEAFWDGMEAAYRVFLANPDADEDESGWTDVDEEFSNHTAYYLHAAGQAHRAAIGLPKKYLSWMFQIFLDLLAASSVARSAYPLSQCIKLATQEVARAREEDPSISEAALDDVEKAALRAVLVAAFGDPSAAEVEPGRCQ